MEHMDTQQKTKTSDYSGCEEIEVTHEDGAKEAVKVRRVKLSQLHRLARAMQSDNIAERVAIYCDKTVDWADSLTLESVCEVLRIGNTLARPTLLARQKMIEPVDAATLAEPQSE